MGICSVCRSSTDLVCCVHKKAVCRSCFLASTSAAALCDDSPASLKRPLSSSVALHATCTARLHRDWVNDNDYDDPPICPYCRHLIEHADDCTRLTPCLCMIHTTPCAAYLLQRSSSQCFPCPTPHCNPSVSIVNMKPSSSLSKSINEITPSPRKRVVTSHTVASASPSSLQAGMLVPEFGRVSTARVAPVFLSPAVAKAVSESPHSTPQSTPQSTVIPVTDIYDAASGPVSSSLFAAPSEGQREMDACREGTSSAMDITAVDPIASNDVDYVDSRPESFAPGQVAARVEGHGEEAVNREEGEMDGQEGERDNKDSSSVTENPPLSSSSPPPPSPAPQLDDEVPVLGFGGEQIVVDEAGNHLVLASDGHYYDMIAYYSSQGYTLGDDGQCYYQDPAPTDALLTQDDGDLVIHHPSSIIHHPSSSEEVTMIHEGDAGEREGSESVDGDKDLDDSAPIDAPSLLVPPSVGGGDEGGDGGVLEDANPSLQEDDASEYTEEWQTASDASGGSACDSEAETVPDEGGDGESAAKEGGGGGSDTLDDGEVESIPLDAEPADLASAAGIFYLHQGARYWIDAALVPDYTQCEGQWSMLLTEPEGQDEEPGRCYCFCPVDDGMDDGVDDGVDDGIDDGMDDGVDGGVDDGMDGGVDDRVDDGVDDGVDCGVDDGVNDENNAVDDEIHGVNGNVGGADGGVDNSVNDEINSPEAKVLDPDIHDISANPTVNLPVNLPVNLLVNPTVSPIANLPVISLVKASYDTLASTTASFPRKLSSNSSAHASTQLKDLVDALSPSRASPPSPPLHLLSQSLSALASLALARHSNEQVWKKSLEKTIRSIESQSVLSLTVTTGMQLRLRRLAALVHLDEGAGCDSDDVQALEIKVLSEYQARVATLESADVAEEVDGPTVHVSLREKQSEPLIWSDEASQLKQQSVDVIINSQSAAWRRGVSAQPRSEGRASALSSARALLASCSAVLERRKTQVQRKDAAEATRQRDNALTLSRREKLKAERDEEWTRRREALRALLQGVPQGGMGGRSASVTSWTPKHGGDALPAVSAATTDLHATVAVAGTHPVTTLHVLPLAAEALDESVGEEDALTLPSRRVATEPSVDSRHHPPVSEESTNISSIDERELDNKGTIHSFESNPEVSFLRPVISMDDGIATIDHSFDEDNGRIDDFEDWSLMPVKLVTPTTVGSVSDSSPHHPEPLWGAASDSGVDADESIAEHGEDVLGIIEGEHAVMSADGGEQIVVDEAGNHLVLASDGHYYDMIAYYSSQGYMLGDDGQWYYQDPAPTDALLTQDDGETDVSGDASDYVEHLYEASDGITYSLMLPPGTTLSPEELERVILESLSQATEPPLTAPEEQAYYSTTQDDSGEPAAQEWHASEGPESSYPSDPMTIHSSPLDPLANSLSPPSQSDPSTNDESLNAGTTTVKDASTKEASVSPPIAARSPSLDKDAGLGLGFVSARSVSADSEDDKSSGGMFSKVFSLFAGGKDKKKSGKSSKRNKANGTSAKDDSYRIDDKLKNESEFFYCQETKSWINKGEDKSKSKSTGGQMPPPRASSTPIPPLTPNATPVVDGVSAWGDSQPRPSPMRAVDPRTRRPVARYVDVFGGNSSIESTITPLKHSRSSPSLTGSDIKSVPFMDPLNETIEGRMRSLTSSGVLASTGDDLQPFSFHVEKASNKSSSVSPRSSVAFFNPSPDAGEIRVKRRSNPSELY